MSKTALVFLATIPASVNELAITVKNARVRFVSGTGKDLTVKVSDPEQWRFVAEAGVFLQKAGKHTATVDVDGDVVVGKGGVVIGRGRNGGQVSVGEGGVYIGGSVKGGIINTGTVINTGGGAFFGGDVICGGDFIAGDKICTEDTAAASLECIEIAVPQDYAGSLNLVWSGSVEADLGDFSAGSINLSGSGNARIDAGRLEGLDVFELKARGSTYLNCRSIRTAVFSYESEGSGSATIQALRAEVVNVSVSGVCRLSVDAGGARCGSVKASGCSTVEFRGDFKKLKAERSLTSAVTIG
ncbi:MAG TPA: hypothetical protein PKN86_02860 [Candidatus Obscuribacter sp.]|nr:hypothetical protein [Candidatus Obscuribacter sp.]